MPIFSGQIRRGHLCLGRAEAKRGSYCHRTV